jgi:hypothetical protein
MDSLQTSCIAGEGEAAAWIRFRRDCSRAEGTMIEKNSEETENTQKQQPNQVKCIKIQNCIIFNFDAE